MSELTFEPHGRATVSFDLGEVTIHNSIYSLCGYALECTADGGGDASQQGCIVVRVDSGRLSATVRDSPKVPA